MSSQLWYKEKYNNTRGQLISLPITPELMHCYHVNDITSEVREMETPRGDPLLEILFFETSKSSVCLQLKYKEDLMWLRGLGCFLYDTPEMVHVRNITKQRVRDGTLCQNNISAFISVWLR